MLDYNRKTPPRQETNGGVENPYGSMARLFLLGFADVESEPIDYAVNF